MRALFSDGVQKKGALWKPNGSGGRLGAGKPTGRRNEGRMKLALHGRTLRVAAIEPTLQNKCVVPCDPIACTSTARHPILWHKESHTLLWLLRLLLAFSALIPPAQSEAGPHRRAALLCGRSKTGWCGSVHLCSRCRCCCDTRDAQLRCCSCACAFVAPLQEGSCPSKRPSAFPNLGAPRLFLLFPVPSRLSRFGVTAVLS